ncbi:DUF397 domain-containing protein [Actinophytocola sp.]|uniref:DUF397 domain-containing protein n=1 Tax=Actinophytocola sp. TaxID=1872138 RepID=UPI002ED4C5DC
MSTWRKSTFSNDQSMCVEINGARDAIRDSKNPAAELRLPGGAVAELVGYASSSAADSSG